MLCEPLFPTILNERSALMDGEGASRPLSVPLGLPFLTIKHSPLPIFYHFRASAVSPTTLSITPQVLAHVAVSLLFLLQTEVL